MQTIRIYIQDSGIKLRIEKCGMLIMKSGDREITRGIEIPRQKNIRKMGKGKHACEYWNLKLSNKQKKKRKKGKSISDERECFSQQHSVAEISGKRLTPRSFTSLDILYHS